MKYIREASQHLADGLERKVIPAGGWRMERRGVGVDQRRDLASGQLHPGRDVSLSHQNLIVRINRLPLMRSKFTMLADHANLGVVVTADQKHLADDVGLHGWRGDSRGADGEGTVDRGPKRPAARERNPPIAPPARHHCARRSAHELFLFAGSPRGGCAAKLSANAERQSGARS